MQPTAPTPIIRHRSEMVVSPWVTVVGKEVLLPGREHPEVYHCISQANYVSILARTPSGLIPLVRQYRPAVEQFTWEFPAGLLDTGESPETACIRELQEEAGLTALRIHNLGECLPDTGRLENRMYTYFVEATEPDPAFSPEPGLELAFVNARTLADYVRTGRFRHVLHLGLLASAYCRGFWDRNQAS